MITDVYLGIWLFSALCCLLLERLLDYLMVSDVCSVEGRKLACCTGLMPAAMEVCEDVGQKVSYAL